MFLKILQSSQENTCVEVFVWKSCKPETRDIIEKETLVFSWEFYEIFKDTFLQKTSGRLLLLGSKPPQKYNILTYIFS